jgi:hypothetical protein
LEDLLQWEVESRVVHDFIHTVFIFIQSYQERMFIFLWHKPSKLSTSHSVSLDDAAGPYGRLVLGFGGASGRADKLAADAGG